MQSCKRVHTHITHAHVSVHTETLQTEAISRNQACADQRVQAGYPGRIKATNPSAVGCRLSHCSLPADGQKTYSLKLYPMGAQVFSRYVPVMMKLEAK